jgi:hypothetical protein
VPVTPQPPSCNFIHCRNNAVRPRQRSGGINECRFDGIPLHYRVCLSQAQFLENTTLEHQQIHAYDQASVQRLYHCGIEIFIVDSGRSAGFRPCTPHNDHEFFPWVEIQGLTEDAAA